jgi:NAD(P) transhydrogenase subunit alpha
VRSVGAKFLEIDLGETGETAGGYAKELTPEQVEKQRQAQKDVIAKSDVVITTAQVFGRKPPVLITRDMIEGMAPGSVIVDMAAETGGNVEGSVPNEVVVISGVTVIGKGNLAGEVARDASQMYSANLFNLVEDSWSKDDKTFVINFEHDILPGCIITHGGEVTNKAIKTILEGSA